MFARKLHLFDSVQSSRPFSRQTGILFGLGLLLAGPVSLSRGESWHSPVDESAALPFFFFQHPSSDSSAVRFVAWSKSFRAIFGPSQLEVYWGHVAENPSAQKNSTLKVDFPGSAAVSPKAVDPLQGTLNLYGGNDSQEWRTGLSTYEKLQYRNLYPGVTLEYRNLRGVMKSELTFGPMADTSQVKFRYSGIQGLQLDEQGNLIIHTQDGQLIDQAPAAYQVEQGMRREVAVRYVLMGSDTVSYEIGPYDPALSLVIDPELVYASYFGGSEGDGSAAIAADSDGNSYITGFTESPDFPTNEPTPPILPHPYDVYVSKISRDGQSVLYTTILGGNGNDLPNDLSIDPGRRVSIVGTTNSSDYPVLGALLSSPSPKGDSFAATLNPNGTLLYSTYLGGGEFDEADGVASDATGKIYVTGRTRSADFPVKNALQPSIHPAPTLDDRIDVFLLKLNPLLTGPASLVWGTFLGGTLKDEGQAVDVDPTGAAYVSGRTFSNDFPTTPSSFQPNFSGGKSEGFVTKFAPGGNALVYSTYFGGATHPPLTSSADEDIYGIAVAADGTAALCGRTTSTDFPLHNAFRSAFGSPTDILEGFVSLLNPTGDGLLFSTFVGGSGQEVLLDVSRGPDGGIWVTGNTGSHDYVTLNELQGDPADDPGIVDAVLTKLSEGGQLLFSTYLGGATDHLGRPWGADRGVGVAVDPFGDIHLLGYTGSVDFPTKNAMFPNFIGQALFSDPFIAKLSDSQISPPPPTSEEIPALDPAGLLILFVALAALAVAMLRHMVAG